MTDGGFATPQQAVERLSALVAAEDGAGLARVTDLEGSGIPAGAATSWSR